MFWVREPTHLSNLRNCVEQHCPRKKINIFRWGMCSHSHLGESFRVARKQNLSFGRGRVGAWSLPSLQDRMLGKHVAINIEDTKHSEPTPLFPPSSQHSCLSLLPNARRSVPDGNSQRPLQSCRGHSGEGRGAEQSCSVLQAPGSPAPALAPLPQPPESPRGHLVIRCPSDVFTFFLTADTSGAHIQVLPVPLDTFHKIISAVVMAKFLPPVIFKLHDRNSWS